MKHLKYFENLEFSDNIFKPGDYVKCINIEMYEENLKLNQIYQIYQSDDRTAYPNDRYAYISYNNIEKRRILL